MIFNFAVSYVYIKTKRSILSGAMVHMFSNLLGSQLLSPYSTEISMTIRYTKLDKNRQVNTQPFFRLYSVPHATIASKIGFKLYPVSVKVYSTRGGTSGYTFRVSSPLSSIARKLAVNTF